MGLLTVIRKTKQKEKEIRLLTTGLDCAGKTTIVKRLLGEEISKISPTFGFSINTLVYQGFRLNIWDIGGQKSLRPYWKNYFENTEGLVWVVDSADIDRVLDCKQELQSLLLEERIAGAPLLIFANKQDLQNSLKVEDIVEILDLERLGNRHYKVVPSSALTGEGIFEGFDWLIKDIKHKYFYNAEQ